MNHPNSNLWPFNMYMESSHVHCNKPDGVLGLVRAVIFFEGLDGGLLYDPYGLQHMCVRTCVYVLATDGVVTFVSAAAGAGGFV